MLCLNVKNVLSSSFFFFNDTATTEIYTLSLHDALPIWLNPHAGEGGLFGSEEVEIIAPAITQARADRKSTRLNSSHLVISYAVFCLKKKKHNVSTQLFLHAPVHWTVTALCYSRLSPLYS